MKLILALSTLLFTASLAAAEEATKITGTFNLATKNISEEHQVPDCSLTHLPLPKPPPEGQMFQLQMLSSQSQMVGSRVMVAGFVAADDSVKGTFGYRDAQGQQWLPSGEALDEQQALTLSLDGKPFNQWVAAADRTKGEYLAQLEFSIETPLMIFSETGLKPAGQTTASFQGQCWITIPWLPEGLYLQ